MSTTKPRTRVVDALAELETRQGRLTPAQVVEAASEPSSPIHGCFEWDNTRAGHKYRLTQAAELIRSVRVEVTTADAAIRTVKYVADASDDSRYQRWAKVRASEVADVLEAELARIAGNIERTIGIALAKSDDVPDGLLDGLMAQLAAMRKLQDLL